MAENDNITPKVETKTGTETTPPVQEPVSTATPKDVTPPDLGVITSDNSGKTDTREDPSKMVETGVESSKAEENTTPTSSPQASSLSLEELQEKQRMGLLSLEEQQALEQKQNQPNDGSLKKKKDNDIAPTDPKEKEFKEGDVIAYMYEKWLIAGALWCAEKVEKYFDYGCYKLRAHIQEQNAERKAKLQGTTTYKTMEKIAGRRNDNGELEGGLYGKKKKEIMDRFEQTNKDITDIGVAINNGTLFDGQNKELLKKYEKMIGADTEEGKKKLEATRTACETRKANPNNEEAALGTKKIAAEFARDARINLTFDTKAEIAALDLTTANVLTGISYNKDNCKTAEKDFATQFDANVKKIKEIAQSDREEALDKADERDRLQAQYESCTGIKKPYGKYMSSKVEKQWEQSFSTLNGIEKNAKDGIKHAEKDIASGRIVELEKEPRTNTSLDAANRLIAAKQQVTNSSQKTQTQEVDTPPVAPADQEKTLKEEGIVQAQADEEIAKKQKQVETDPRTAENARREQAHEDRGKKINPRIEEIKARALASRQAKQSGAEFMVDTMLANGNLTEDQQKALLDAGIAAEKNGKDGSTDEILKNMRESGQFSQDQIKTAREVNFAYGLAQKTGRE